MFGLQPLINQRQTDCQDIRPYAVLLEIRRASTHPSPVATPPTPQNHHHYHLASVLGRRRRDEDDTNNDYNARPSLNSGEVGPSANHSSICHRDSVLRMEVASSNKPSSEGLRIAHNVVNELGELNDSRLVEGNHFGLRDLGAII